MRSGCEHLSTRQSVISLFQTIPFDASGFSIAIEDHLLFTRITSPSLHKEIHCHAEQWLQGIPLRALKPSADQLSSALPSNLIRFSVTIPARLLWISPAAEKATLTRISPPAGIQLYATLHISPLPESTFEPSFVPMYIWTCTIDSANPLLHPQTIT